MYCGVYERVVFMVAGEHWILTVAHLLQHHGKEWHAYHHNGAKQ